MRMIFFTFVMLVLGCNQSSSTYLLQLQKYDTNQALLFQVKEDGRIFFAGGMDAIFEQPSWEGQLTTIQIQELKERLVGLNFETCTQKRNDEDRFVVIFDGLETQFDLSNIEVASLSDQLEKIVQDRFSTVVNSLPKPTADVIMNRSIEGERNRNIIQPAVPQSSP